MTSRLLSIESVDKFYGSGKSGVHAVKDLDMAVEPGEIVALLGSSGCGKTTTLRMVAGFEAVSNGRISLNGRDIHGLPPVKRHVAMAFEGYSLYPTVSVRENIAFALKAAKLGTAEVAKRVDEVASMLEITGILDRFPSSISGGQQQRASLARALVRDANLHLLDEPMGQLEPQLRTLLRGRIKHFIKDRGLTAILVTHDQTEANALADRIAVMEGGVLQQYASPLEIKERPSNFFTGTFVGEPPMNVMQAHISTSNDRIDVKLEGGVDLSFSADSFEENVRQRMVAHEKVVIGVRPYAVHRDEEGPKATVVTNQWLGDQTHIAASFAGGTIVLVEHDRVRLNEGDTICINIRPDDLHIFDPGSGNALSHGRELA